MSDEQQRQAETCDSPPRAGSARLTNLLIGKSIAEALFVAALAVIFSYQSFHPFFRGSVDAADESHVAGWVVDDAVPGARVEVQLFIDNHFAGSRTAHEARPDVAAAGRARDAFHGFIFDTPPLPRGTYEARVYAVHAAGSGEQRRALQMIGSPLTYTVEREPVEKSADVWWHR